MEGSTKNRNEIPMQKISHIEFFPILIAKSPLYQLILGTIKFPLSRRDCKRVDYVLTV